jgi:hypothetical protein
MSARIVTLAVFAMLVAAGSSRAASPLEMNFYLSGPRYEAEVPLCQDGWPLDVIKHRFGATESRFWNAQLEIVGYENVREISFRPWVQSAMPRRFCRATVLVSDGKKRPLYYSIIEGAGVIGMNWGVEFCIVGLDRDWAYNPACKMAKP